MFEDKAKYILILVATFFLFFTTANAQVRVLTAPQGGTGIGSASAGDIGFCLKVLSVSPFAYTLGSCGTGGGGSGTDTLFSWNATTNEINTDGASTTATTTIKTSAIVATSTTVNSNFVGLTASRSTTTAASSTNFFSSILTATNGFFTNLFGTNATITTGTSTNWFSSILTATDSFFTNLLATNATNTRLYTSSLGLNSEYFSDLTGTGLQNSSGVLTLNATGDWTGTLDGFDGATLAQGNWLFNGTRLAPSSTVGLWVGASSTIDALSSRISTSTAATSTNFFSSILTATTGFFGSLFGTDATISNATTTNLAANSFKIGLDVITDITGTNLSVTNGVLSATGGGSSNWLFDGTRLTPSSTAGISVNASSSIFALNVFNGTTTNSTSTRVYTSLFGLNSEYFSDLTGFGLANSSGALGINTTGAADGECLTYVASGPTIDWITCASGGGGGGGGWATTTGDNAETGETLSYTSNDVLIGGTSVASSEFNFDPETSRFTISSTSASATGTIDSVVNALRFGSTTREQLEINWNNADTLRLFSSTGLSLFDFGSIAFTATSGTTTNFFATNASTSNFWGAGLSACTGANKVTWSAGKFGCDTDQTGAGGGSSNWIRNIALDAITPSSTVGISVGASSTIGNGTGAGGLTVAGTATTTGDMYVGTSLGVATSTFGNLAVFNGRNISNANDLVRIIAPPGFSGGGGAYFRAQNASGTTLFSVNSFGNFTAANGSTFSGTAGTAPHNATIVSSPTGSQNGISVKGGAGYTGDYFRILDNSNNILLNFSGTSSALGIGSSTPSRTLTVNGDIYGANITATGTGIFANLSANGLSITGTSTLGFASSTALTVSGATYLNTFTANSGTTTNATSTNLSVSGSLKLFGGAAVVSANALCIQLTGSANLCDGSDDGGGGGGFSNWIRNIAGDSLTPSTTVGISVNASSTISELAVPTSINLFRNGAVTSANALCIQLTGSADLCDGSDGGGGGSSKWTDAGLFTYLTDTPDDIVFGATSTTSAPFWWDVSATTSYIGNGGAGDSVITFGPSTSPWTIGFDDTDDYFKISTSTALGGTDLLTLFATSTAQQASTTAGTLFSYNTLRTIFGNRAYTGTSNFLPLDALNINGTIDQGTWVQSECIAPVPSALTGAALSSDSSLACGNFMFQEDTTGTIAQVVTGGFGHWYNQIRVANALANDGAGLFLLGTANSFGSSTPIFKTVARIDSPANASNTVFYLGFTDLTPSAGTFEASPGGCYFVASSTQANWNAYCGRTNGNGTFVDTGVASTTSQTAAANQFYRFSIYGDGRKARFYIATPTQSQRLVAEIDISLNETQWNVGTYFATRQGGGGNRGLDVKFISASYNLGI